MNFGQAIELLKQGQRLKRAGWNGANMFIYLNNGSYAELYEDKSPLISGVARSLFNNGGRGTTKRMPNINMHTADGATVTGWLASQTDMLAEDWELLT